MKKVILLLLLLTACQLSGFAGVEKDVERISTKYGTHWKEEQVAGTMSPLQTMGLHITDIIKLRESTLAGQDAQKNASLLFIEARLSTLKSQKHFQEAQQLDPRPLVELKFGSKTPMSNDPITMFSCGNAEKVSQATALLQLSLEEAHTAINQLDKLLQDYEYTRQIIGMDDLRPLFYKAKLGSVWSTIETNKVLLNRCS